MCAVASLTHASFSCDGPARPPPTQGGEATSTPLSASGSMRSVAPVPFSGAAPLPRLRVSETGRPQATQPHHQSGAGLQHEEPLRPEGAAQGAAGNATEQAGAEAVLEFTEAKVKTETETEAEAKQRFAQMLVASENTAWAQHAREDRARQSEPAQRHLEKIEEGGARGATARQAM